MTDPADTSTARRPRGRPPRRRQEERTAATRQALLDATIDTLVAEGYGRTTTTAITRRAGVSVGALQHHFATKAELMAAAVEHVLARRHDEFAKAMAGLEPGVDRLDAATDVLWSCFCSPTFVAWAELWVAARTDPPLAEAMRAVDAHFFRTSQRLFAEVLADLPAEVDDHGRDVSLAFVFAVLDGTAMARLLGPRPELPPADDIVAAVKDVGRLVFPRHPQEGPR